MAPGAARNDGSPRPRLVRPDEPLLPAPPERRTAGRLGVVLLAVLFAVAAGIGVQQMRRAAALEARVTELSTALVAARVEIDARRAQLETIRASVADVRERIAGLEAVAAQDPGAPAAPAAPTPIR
jgi:uncharacterized coiled-coil protein SlyX